MTSQKKAMRIFIVMVVWLNYIVATIREICVIRVRYYIRFIFSNP